MNSIAWLGIGPYQADSLGLSLAAAGIELVRMPILAEWGSQRRPSAVARVVEQWSGSRDEAYLDAMTALLDAKDVRYVIAGWGTAPLPEIRALRRRRPQVRFVLHLLCHPIGLEPMRVALQHALLHHALETLSGIIVTSETMRTYLCQRIRGAESVPMHTMPPYTAKAFAPTAPLPATMAEPNCIFLGRTDWSRAQPSDSVEGQLRELMDLGVDVYYGASKDAQMDHEHARPFKPTTWRDASDFAAAFDASLITYNLQAVKVKDRFEVTVPDRLITSVAAGIPVALPREGYAACAEYLSEYPATLRFGSMAELAERLHDRAEIDRLRRAGRASCPAYRQEPQIAALLAFLESL